MELQNGYPPKKAHPILPEGMDGFDTPPRPLFRLELSKHVLASLASIDSGGSPKNDENPGLVAIFPDSAWRQSGISTPLAYEGLFLCGGGRGACGRRDEAGAARRRVLVGFCRFLVEGTPPAMCGCQGNQKGRSGSFFGVPPQDPGTVPSPEIGGDIPWSSIFGCVPGFECDSEVNILRGSEGCFWGWFPPIDHLRDDGTSREVRGPICRFSWNHPPFLSTTFCDVFWEIPSIVPILMM